MLDRFNHRCLCAETIATDSNWCLHTRIILIEAAGFVELAGMATVLEDLLKTSHVGLLYQHQSDHVHVYYYPLENFKRYNNPRSDDMYS